MELEWMERYGELFAALVYYSNASSRCTVTSLNSSGKAANISNTEYQILTYICEFADDQKIMADISRDLGILPSIVTKSTKHLFELGYIEKYHLQGNKKSIILRPTDTGRQIYAVFLNEHLRPSLSSFFDALSSISDADLKVFGNAVKMLCNSVSSVDGSSITPGLTKII